MRHNIHSRFLMALVFVATAASAAERDYYLLPCAVSPMSEKGQPASQRFGHAAIFIGGVCLDRTSELPQLTTDCPNGSEDGVGLSSNQYFKNVRWIGSPGFDFFMNGNLKEGDRLDRAAYDALTDRIIESKLMAPIESHPLDWMKLTDDKLHNEKAKIVGSLGTDFALRWARNVTCARIPITKRQAESIVPYVNHLNREYVEEDREFKLSFYNNNCSHLVHNVVWAAGLWDKKEFEERFPLTVGTVAVPLNTVVDVYRSIVTDEPNSVLGVYRDPRRARLLVEGGQLAGHDGTLAVKFGVHGERDPSLNEMFETTNTELGLLDIPLLNVNLALLKMVFAEPRFSNAESNRQTYLGIYRNRLYALKPTAAAYGEVDPFERSGGPRGGRFRRVRPKHPYEFSQVYEAYRAFLERRLAELGDR